MPSWSPTLAPMDEPQRKRALIALGTVAARLGLATHSTAVLHASNRLAIRVSPCEVLARVAFDAHSASAQYELDVALEAARRGAPAERPAPGVEPNVFLEDGFAITFWTYYETIPGPVSPRQYAGALEQFHTAMRNAALSVPHFSSRFEEAERLTADPELSPALEPADRAFLLRTLRKSNLAITRRGAKEQVIHGEPHPGNILSTPDGPLFIDLETCVVGPVEFDLATAPPEVATHYPDLDAGLLRECGTLTRALVAAWRWDRNDVFPGGRQMGEDLLAELRATTAP